MCVLHEYAAVGGEHRQVGRHLAAYSVRSATACRRRRSNSRRARRGTSGLRRGRRSRAARAACGPSGSCCTPLLPAVAAACGHLPLSPAPLAPNHQIGSAPRRRRGSRPPSTRAAAEEPAVGRVVPQRGLVAWVPRTAAARGGVHRQEGRAPVGDAGLDSITLILGGSLTTTPSSVHGRPSPHMEQAVPPPPTRT